jgi:hypothetical protein
MTCSDFTTNNRPLGAGTDSRGRARSLVELSGINVTDVSSTGSIYASSITPGVATDLIIYGRVSATAYLGAGGGGATTFLGLSDVEPGTTLTPGHIVVVTDTSSLTVEDPASILVGFQPYDQALQTISDLVIPGSQQTIVVFSNEGAATALNLQPFGQTLLGTATNTDAKNSLAITYQDLIDSQNYAASDAYKSLIVNAAGTGIILSAISGGGGGGGGGVTDHGALTGLTDDDHPQYVLSSTNSTLSSTVNSHITTADIHFTSGSLSAYYAASSWVNANYSPTSHSHSQYALTSTLNDHIASASVHFTSESLSPTYVLSSINFALSSNVSNHISDNSIHFTSGSLSSEYSRTSHSHVFSALSGLSDVTTAGLSVGARLTWGGSNWFPEAATLPTQNKFGDLGDIDGPTVSPSSVSSTYVDGSPLVFDTVSLMWEGRNLPVWVSGNLVPYLSSFVLSSTNLALSSSVSDHIASASVHFTSGSLSSAYVLISDNSALSSAFNNHLASAVHWDLNTLNINYLNSSGDSANAAFYLQNISAAIVSATTVSAGTLHIGGSDGNIVNTSGAILFSSTGGFRFSSTVNDVFFNQEVKSSVAAVDSASFVRKNEFDEANNTLLTVVLPLHTTDTSIHFTSGSLSPAFVLSSINFALSSNVSNHIASSDVHFTSGQLVPHFISVSGGTYPTANLIISSVSAASYSGVSLSGLRDVTIASVSNDQVLTWSAAGNRWVNKTFTGGAGATKLFELLDVDPLTMAPAITPTGQSLLIWDDALSLYVLADPSVYFGSNSGYIPHSGLASLADGDPHTQYTLKEGLTGKSYIVAKSLF